MAATIAEMVRERAHDDRTALLFEDCSWSYSAFATECAKRAVFLDELRRRHRSPDRRFHVGILADNIPEFPFWLGAAALAGATVVGINPTRRGAELERDIAHTKCSMIVTEPHYLPLLEGISLEMDRSLVFDSTSEAYAKALAPYSSASLTEVDSHPEPSSVFLLIFTSGTSAAPKAVICSQGRLAMIGSIVAQMFSINESDVCYQAMPMFHSNALMACWAPALSAGAAFAMRRRFSASAFIDDVRRFRATYFNYVGKTLAYVLATPERPDDASNPLVRGFGNEGTRTDVEEFSRRFGCKVTDAYGSTEGGASISASPDTPPGALGPAPNGTVVCDPATGKECPRARFDEEGRLLNADEAIGEIVNNFGSMTFEGYWDNEEATAERLRDGRYWTGDLGYIDEAGFIYFAGRNYDWLRVDGENFAAAPIERICSRHPDVCLAAVYAVPDPVNGDRVMAALQLRQEASFDPEGFASFLAAQPDLGTKWAPTFVRICASIPTTESNKVLKRALRAERWECDDPVYWQPRFWEAGATGQYRQLTAQDVDELRELFRSRGREQVLEAT